jgi:hypothetical protein
MISNVIATTTVIAYFPPFPYASLNPSITQRCIATACKISEFIVPGAVALQSTDHYHMTTLQEVEVEKLHSQVYDIHSQSFQQEEEVVVVVVVVVVTLQHQGAEEEIVVHNIRHLHPISDSHKPGQYNIVDNLVHHRKELQHQEHMKILPEFQVEQTFQVETFVVKLEVVEVVEVDNALLMKVELQKYGLHMIVGQSR